MATSIDAKLQDMPKKLYAQLGFPSRARFQQGLKRAGLKVSAKQVQRSLADQETAELLQQPRGSQSERPGGCPARPSGRPASSCTRW